MKGVIMADLHINKKGWEFQWTPEEDKIIKENYTSKGYDELEQMLPNRSKKAIQARAFKLGVKYLSYNKDYFNKIDTPTKAYWLGFLYADGYATGSNRWGLELKYDDMPHMEKLLTELDYNGKIRERERNGVKSCSVQFNNSVATNSLISLGVVNNKTTTLQFPSSDLLNEIYYPDFIRGFFDGDGCVTWGYYTKPRKDRQNKVYTRLRKEVNIVCKSEKFIQSIYDILERNDIHLNWTVNHRDNLITLRTSKIDEIVKIYNFLYKNSCNNNRLERKYDKFNSLLKAVMLN